jgi:hypothetical protein
VIRSVLATGSAVQKGWFSTVDLLIDVTLNEHGRKIQIKYKTSYYRFSLILLCSPIVLAVLTTGNDLQKGCHRTIDFLVEVIFLSA